MPEWHQIMESPSLELFTNHVDKALVAWVSGGLGSTREWLDMMSLRVFSNLFDSILPVSEGGL